MERLAFVCVTVRAHLDDVKATVDAINVDSAHNSPLLWATVTALIIGVHLFGWRPLDRQHPLNRIKRCMC